MGLNPDIFEALNGQRFRHCFYTLTPVESLTFYAKASFIIHLVGPDGLSFIRNTSKHKNLIVPISFFFSLFLHCFSFDDLSRETILHIMDRNELILFVSFREQLMFPLHFVDMLGRFDVEASVEGGGHSSQAGALRLAISRALLSFVSNGDVENMRQGERETHRHCFCALFWP